MLFYMALLFLLLQKVQNAQWTQFFVYILFYLHFWDWWYNLAELVDKQKFVNGVKPDGPKKPEHTAQSINDLDMQMYGFRNIYCIALEIWFSAVSFFPLNVNYYFKQIHKLIIFKVINFQSNFYLLSKCQTILEFEIITDAFQNIQGYTVFL